MSAIWQKLSSIDISKHTEKKGQLTYLSWATAWGYLMEHFPLSEWHALEPITYPDGTVMVRSVVTVRDGESSLTRAMFLPVMDHRNGAVPGPDARKISDAQMRCLVKNLALFGLGHSLYMGEDLQSLRPFDPDDREFMLDLLEQGEPLAFLNFWQSLPEQTRIELYNSGEPGQKVKLKKAVDAIEREAYGAIDTYESEINHLVAADDPAAYELMVEASGSGPKVKALLWGRLSAEVQKSLLTMKETQHGG